MELTAIAALITATQNRLKAARAAGDTSGVKALQDTLNRLYAQRNAVWGD